MDRFHTFDEIYGGHKEIHQILNPERMEQPSRGVFSQPTETNDLLRNFEVRKFLYETIWPKGVTPEHKEAAAQASWKLHAELNAFIAIPQSLCNTTELMKVKPWIRIHGGGGTTGCPQFAPWAPYADYAYILEAGDIISVEPTYCLLPESSGWDILKNMRKFADWVCNGLHAAVESVNPNLEIDWTHLAIFGESFGGGLAVVLWTYIGSLDLKISGLVLRDPLVELYRRASDEYCGIFVSGDEAKEACEHYFRIKDRLPFIVPRSSSQPPNGMYFANTLSVSGYWEIVWEARPVIDMLQVVTSCPDGNTKVFITHGTQDRHVPHASSIKLYNVFRAKWPSMDVDLVLREGEAHGSSNGKPLSSDYRKMLAGF